MPEITSYTFAFQEVAKLLIREQGITEGHWLIGVNFSSIGLNTSLNNQSHLPTVVTQLTGLALQRVPEPTPLSVDAATVNPFPSEIALK